MTDQLQAEDIEVLELRRRMIEAEDQAVAHERAAEVLRREHSQLRSQLEETLASRYP